MLQLVLQERSHTPLPWLRRWTGADLGALLSEAQLIAVHGVLDARTAAEAAPEGSGVESVAKALPAEGGGTKALGDSAGGVRDGAGGGSGDGAHTASSAAAMYGAAAQDSTAVAAAARSSAGASGTPEITRAHLLAALVAARPSLPVGERTRLEAIYGRFRAARDPNIGTRDSRGKGAKKATLA